MKRPIPCLRQLSTLAGQPQSLVHGSSSIVQIYRDLGYQNSLSDSLWVGDAIVNCAFRRFAHRASGRKLSNDTDSYSHTTDSLQTQVSNSAIRHRGSSLKGTVNKKEKDVHIKNSKNTILTKSDPYNDELPRYGGNMDQELYERRIAISNVRSRAVTKSVETAKDLSSLSAIERIKFYLKGMEEYLAGLMPQFERTTVDHKFEQPSELQTAKRRIDDPKKIDYFRDAIGAQELHSSYLAESIKSVLEFFVGEGDQQGSFVHRMNSVQLRLQLLEPAISKRDLDTVIESILTIDQTDIKLVEMLLPHMYRHRMFSELIELTLHLVDFDQAESLIRRCLIEQFPEPELVLSNILRGCLQVKQDGFARHLLVELAYYYLPANGFAGEPPFLDLSLQKQQLLLDNAVLEVDLSKIRDVETVRSLIANSLFNNMIEKSYSLRSLTILKCVELDMSKEALTLLRSYPIKDPAHVISEILELVDADSTDTESLDFICEAANMIKVDKYISSTFDVFVPLVRRLSRHTLPQYWNCIMHGSQSNTEFANADQMTKELVNAFVERATQIGSWKFACDILLSNAKYLKFVDQSRLRILIERMLLSGNGSVLANISESKAVILSVGLLRSMGNKQMNGLLSKICQRIRSGLVTYSREHEILFIRMLLTAISRSGVNVSAATMDSLAQLISKDDVSAQTDFLIQFQDLFTKSSISVLVRKHLIERRLRADYDVQLLSAATVAFYKRASAAQLESFVKQSIVEIFCTVPDDRDKANSILDKTQNLRLRAAVSILAALQSSGFRPTHKFFAWFLRQMINNDFMNAALTVLHNDGSHLTRQDFEYFHFNALASGRPDLLLRSIQEERKHFITPRPKFIRRILRSLFGFITSFDETVEWSFAVQCAHLMISLREDHKATHQRLITHRMEHILRMARNRANRIRASGRVNAKSLEIVDQDQFTAILQASVWDGVYGRSKYGQWRMAIRQLGNIIKSSTTNLSMRSEIDQTMDKLRNEIHYFFNMRFWWCRECGLIVGGHQLWLSRRIPWQDWLKQRSGMISSASGKTGKGVLSIEVHRRINREGRRLSRRQITSLETTNRAKSIKIGESF
ncbi:hypothetical protein V1511DRAFT_498795 [Dipodascopsis uninucleata]